jgi:hypothetical protein
MVVKQRLAKGKMTGLDMDYMNEYAVAYYTYFLFPTLSNKTLPKEYKILHYDERFDPAIFDVDMSNIRIPVLNDIADCMNERFKEGRVSEEEFNLVQDAIRDFIDGRF